MGIELQNVSKNYGDVTVVDGVSLKIADGEFVVLLGPSGCGKTTTLRIMAGLEQTTAGDILIDGRRVNDLPPQKRDVAMVFQSYALYPHMTVADNIAYPLRVRKLPAAEISTQVQQTAAMLEIEALLARRPRELSGGERQRVALARAIVRHPKAFLMDEPLSNLDARLRLQMRGELKRLQHELATTTVYVTHDQAEAMTLGHRVAVMNTGQLQQFDTPLEIYNQPANRFVAEFVGSPSMNLIDGEFDSTSKTFTANDGALRFVNIQGIAADGPVTFGIRPEDIQISATQQDGWWQGDVYVTELMGSETFVIVEIGKHKIVARAASDFRAETGSSVWIDFDFRKAHWFDAQTGMRIEVA